MLFAPSAATKHGTSLPEQLTSLRCKHEGPKDARKREINTSKASQQQKQTLLANGLLHADEGKAELSNCRNSKAEDIVEAMKKFDAKLVAYLAGEDLPTKSVEKSNFASLEDNVPLQYHLLTSTSATSAPSTPLSTEGGLSNHAHLAHSQQLEVFKRISAIRLHMEALTLQSEGTKRMELLRHDIRPIFTVECQLSHELIKQVPRYDMFHIMQFESEKFQSLTQCTRFAQEAQRDVKLSFDQDNNNDNDIATTAGVLEAGMKPNCGRIHFMVWWREPGTCLNEMLGMGMLELNELYHAELLEQCKCIKINRRGMHLASLYVKISMLVGRPAITNIRMDSGIVTAKQCDGGDTSGENPASNNGNQSQKLGENSQKAQKPNTEAANSALSARNNNMQVESTSFSAETSRVRLLKGFIYASETRNLEVSTHSSWYLVCRRFWQDEAIATALIRDGKFNYQEQFAVINDEQFLRRVDKQHLHLELWRCLVDGQARTPQDLEPIGMVRLPLHQFFIAFRDTAITNHLCKSKFPVISIDAWVPIISLDAAAAAGEIKCLLAIGSEEQITNLKDERGFTHTTTANAASGGNVRTDFTMSPIDSALFQQLPRCPFDFDRLHMPLGHNNNTGGMPSFSMPTATTSNAQLRNASDLLGILQKALLTNQQPAAAPPPPVPPEVGATAAVGEVVTPHNDEKSSFQFSLVIQRASGLPLNPAAKGKKGGGRRNGGNAAFKRFPPNEAPSTYVTFQANDCDGNVYRSHEGTVYATRVVEKSTQPQWAQGFRVTADMDYLNNSEKNFILKIWRRAAVNSSQSSLQPNPMGDAIIGFVALDLNAFARGMHIGGWFNLIDFNGRINGQLEVQCQPLENVQKKLQPLLVHRHNLTANTNDELTTTTNVANTASPSTLPSLSPSTSVDAVIDQFEQTLDLGHLNLGQAIKRKFTELQEISQRLRTRLVDVTGEQFPPKFDVVALENWQPLDTAMQEDMHEDDFLLEFERDISTPPPTSPSTSNNPPSTTAASLMGEGAPQQQSAMISAISKASACADDDSPME